MIIELSYWDMFWIGVTVGWILCWYVPVLLNIEVHNHKTNHIKPNYLKPVEFKYQPTKYFKHVPVEELRLANQGGIPNCGGENEYEVGLCLSCLRKFAREKNGKGSSHCDECIKNDKVRSNPPTLPEHSPNK